MKMKPKMKTLNDDAASPTVARCSTPSIEEPERANDSISYIYPSTATSHEASSTKVSRRKGGNVRRGIMRRVDGRHAGIEGDKTGP